VSAALNYALVCQRFGVGTPQCPESGLRYWAEYTRARSPQGYETYFAPLLAQLEPTAPTPAAATAVEPGPRWFVEAALARLQQTVPSARHVFVPYPHL